MVPLKSGDVCYLFPKKIKLCVLCFPYATVMMLLHLVHVPVINGSACCFSNLTELSILERNSS